jgi:acid phosphatase class B
MSERTFLEPFTGSYQRGPAAVTVALKGDNGLTLTIAGQSPLDLVPVNGTKFSVKGMTGFNVEFKGDDLVFYQPNGTFMATRKK